MAGRRRGHHDEGHVNHERWLITYADLITLLMVFFIVMYSMSRADTAKFVVLSAALQKAFHVDVLKGTDPTSLKGSNGVRATTSAIQDSTGLLPSSSPPAAASAAASAALTAIMETRLISTAEELRQVLAALPTPPTGGAVQVGTNRDGVVISLSGNVLFDSGKAELRSEGQVLLDMLVQKLKGMPNDLRIEGHTDNVAIRSTLFPSNWELSSARATTVARYLAGQGIPPQRLIATGYGEYRPATENDTREGRARNRRVDIVILTAPPATFSNADNALPPSLAGGAVPAGGGNTP